MGAVFCDAGTPRMVVVTDIEFQSNQAETDVIRSYCLSYY